MSTNWNSECGKAHGPDWQKWLGHLAGTPAQGLEIGTFKGDSAEWMLANIFTHPDSQYYCVDWFQGSDEHHLGGVDCSMLERETRDRLKPFEARVHIAKGRSNEVLRSIHGERFDFVYVDAAHDAMSVLRDAVLAFDLLKPGGVLIFDDYPWDVMPQPLDRPKIAIDCFIEAYARHLEVIGMGWQVAVKKK